MQKIGRANLLHRSIYFDKRNETIQTPQLSGGGATTAALFGRCSVAVVAYAKVPKQNPMRPMRQL